MASVISVDPSRAIERMPFATMLYSPPALRSWTTAGSNSTSTDSPAAMVWKASSLKPAVSRRTLIPSNATLVADTTNQRVGINCMDRHRLTAREDLGFLDQVAVENGTGLEDLEGGSTSVGDGCLDARVGSSLCNVDNKRAIPLVGLDRNRKRGSCKRKNVKKLHSEGVISGQVLILVGKRIV